MKVFKVIKLKSIVLCFVLACIILTSGVFAFSTKKVNSDVKKWTVVLDAGHGEPDGGAVGVNTGVKESELNLLYVKELKRLFESQNFNVVLTRQNEYSFSYDKIKDMAEREKIINETCPHVVLSIHMNKFFKSECKGVQVFYKIDNNQSKNLAQNIKDMLKENIENARDLVLEGDYYILNCSNYTSVLVECGFLSNSEDEALLITDAYRKKLCYQIFLGVIKYFYTA